MITVIFIVLLILFSLIILLALCKISKLDDEIEEQSEWLHEYKSRKEDKNE